MEVHIRIMAVVSEIVVVEIAAGVAEEEIVVGVEMVVVGVVETNNMEVNHTNGSSVKTEELNDLDSQLMEESVKLHALFRQYKRQLLIVGEMKATKENTSEEGCAFYHVNSITETDEKKLQENFSRFIGRLDGFLRSMTSDKLYITSLPQL